MSNHRINLLKSRLKVSSFVNAIKDPARILALVDSFRDVKLRPFSNDELLKQMQASIGALKRLSDLTFTLPIRTVYDQYATEPTEGSFVELDALFRRHGSDKSSEHDYHYVYSRVLRPKKNQSAKILEIGLGTNKIDVPSNMGRQGQPGASLRAFRDFGGAFEVYGADVDKRILFREDRIETFYVDQTSSDTLANLAARFPFENFDLIIDDGLHTPEANLNFVDFALPLVKDDGVIVVEDVKIEDFPFWQLAAHLLKGRYECSFITCKPSHYCMFIIHRLIKH